MGGIDTPQLVARLRTWAETGQGGRLLAADVRLAADRIEQLEDENQRLREVDVAGIIRAEMDDGRNTWLEVAAAIEQALEGADDE